MKILRLAALTLSLFAVGPLFAAPISTYPAANSPLSGTEQLVGTQAGATVNVTPAQLGNYALTGATLTGPFTGQVAQPLYNGLQPACVNVISFMSAAQQAQVLAGTATFDLTPILNEAWNAVAVNDAGDVKSSHPVCLPLGKMQMHTTWSPRGTAHLIGAGGNGVGGFGYGTLLVVDAGKGGIIVDTQFSSGGGHYSAAGSIFEGFALMTPGDNTDATDGVLVHARSTWRDVTIGGFSHDQMHIVACAGCGGSIEGNANNMLVESSAFDGNPTLVSQTGHVGINGLEIDGADTNGGLFQILNENNLRGWCDRDNAFLQNTHVAEQCAVSGTATRVNLTGVSYRAAPETSSATLAATTPGTNSAIWAPITFSAGYPTWSGAGVYYPGGAYDFPGLSQRISANGLYDEGGDPPSYCQQDSLTIGALNVGGWVGPCGNLIQASGVLLSANSPFGVSLTTSAGASQTMIFGAINGNGFGQGQLSKWTDSSTFPSGLIDAQVDSDQDICRYYGSVTAATIVDCLTGPNTVLAFGRTTALPEAFLPSRLILRDINGSNGRRVFNSAAIPSTTGEAVGSVALNSAPTLGGNAGWIETVQGSPDTWQPFGVVGGAAVLSGTTGSIGGGALTAGTCATGTVAVTSSTTAMAVIATPATYPGDAFTWNGYVSSAGTVTVRVCTNLAAGGTPTASVYNVRVLQ